MIEKTMSEEEIILEDYFNLALQVHDLQQEILRLKSLCFRAADEIEMLDDIIVRNNYEEQTNEEYMGVASVNLLSRLRGRLKGGYIENYPELIFKN